MKTSSSPPPDAIEMLSGQKGKFNLNRSSRIVFQGETAWVELTKGYWSVIDLAAVLLVSRHTWVANWTGSRFYAYSNIDGKNTGMHRLLMKASDADVVDHINGNALDNRFVNLRNCSQKENTRNSRIFKNNSSGFKGVSFRANRYIARIRVDGKEKHLGTFLTAEDAHAAYVNAAREHFGDFARAT